ncbi:MAG: 50S ribosomal protein L23 [Candidatus Levybacteria bacterium]|nr:50S ribosomal protein L23 [Candidatus Levybacteria bacterium]MBI3092981.1 50S ribosomal protein L23 [Candidatus Levybacteria bacterium]
MDVSYIIKRPIISEKSTQDAAKGRFTFEVALLVNKPIIKKAIEDAFKVKVISLTTRIMKGKTKRAGIKRTEVLGSSWKKATVQLAKDQKIDLFEVTQSQS